MSNNPILDWLKNDEHLCNIANQIDASGKDLDERAADAFHQVAEYYDLPKYPDDFTDAHYERFEQMNIDAPRSVFEEATIMKYLEPNDDPRGIVMVALYNVKEGKFIDMDVCAVKHYGSKKRIPKEYTACFIGDGFAGRLHFCAPEESWVELGARSAVKIINPR